MFIKHTPLLINLFKFFNHYFLISPFYFYKNYPTNNLNNKSMALIEWNDSFNVDIEVIDMQHKKLVGMINDFYNQVSNKSSKELIGELIAKMKAYTEAHFKTEENIFKKIN